MANATFQSSGSKLEYLLGFGGQRRLAPIRAERRMYTPFPPEYPALEELRRVCLPAVTTDATLPMQARGVLVHAIHNGLHALFNPLLVLPPEARAGLLKDRRPGLQVDAALQPLSVLRGKALKELQALGVPHQHLTLLEKYLGSHSYANRVSAGCALVLLAAALLPDVPDEETPGGGGGGEGPVAATPTGWLMVAGLESEGTGAYAYANDAGIHLLGGDGGYPRVFRNVETVGAGPAWPVQREYTVPAGSPFEEYNIRVAAPWAIPVPDGTGVYLFQRADATEPPGLWSVRYFDRTTGAWTHVLNTMDVYDGDTWLGRPGELNNPLALSPTSFAFAGIRTTLVDPVNYVYQYHYDCWRYDKTAGAWKHTDYGAAAASSTIPDIRQNGGPRLLALRNGTLLLWGETYYDANYIKYSHPGVYRHNPVTGATTKLTDAPYFSSGPAHFNDCYELADGRLLFLLTRGAFSFDDTDAKNATRHLVTYNPATNTWAEHGVGPFPFRRAYPSYSGMAELTPLFFPQPDGSLYVGYNQGSDTSFTGQPMLYRVAADLATWTQVPTPTTPLETLATLPDGRLVWVSRNSGNLYVANPTPSEVEASQFRALAPAPALEAHETGWLYGLEFDVTVPAGADDYVILADGIDYAEFQWEGGTYAGGNLRYSIETDDGHWDDGAVAGYTGGTFSAQLIYLPPGGTMTVRLFFQLPDVPVAGTLHLTRLWNLRLYNYDTYEVTARIPFTSGRPYRQRIDAWATDYNQGIEYGPNGFVYLHPEEAEAARVPGPTEAMLYSYVVPTEGYGGYHA